MSWKHDISTVMHEEETNTNNSVENYDMIMASP